MQPVPADSSAVSKPGAAHVAARIGAAVFGSYAFVWGFVALGVALAVAAGMSYVEAQNLLYLLAFPLLLGCFCWAFAAASLVRAWIAFAGGGVLMTVAAWLISRALL